MLYNHFLNFFTLVVGVFIGALVVWIVRNREIVKIEGELLSAQEEQRRLQTENTLLKEQKAKLETTIELERKGIDEKIAIIEKAKNDLSDTFRALSSDALMSNNNFFFEMAEKILKDFKEATQADLEYRQKAISEILTPIAESLDSLDEYLNDIEKARIESYTKLQEQIRVLSDSEALLRSETSKLVNALKTPIIRGRWGEVQLKRLVELSGMSKNVDYVEQEPIISEGGRIRPDLIVKLPNNKIIVVDAKTPIQIYLEALESPDDNTRLQKMKDHAKNIQEHIKKLSEKEYWIQFKQTPEFVVMFIPGEVFLSSALEHDPSIIEFGFERGVIIATPTTLFALLKAIAYGWRQEQIAENAQKISDLGKELYERLQIMVDHFENIGKNLEKSIESYNKAVGSFESRVLVAARRFKELGAATGEEIKNINFLDKVPRQLVAFKSQ